MKGKMRVYLEKGPRYFVGFREHGRPYLDVSVEISDDEFKKHKEIFDDFIESQEKLRQMYEAARKS